MPDNGDAADAPTCAAVTEDADLFILNDGKRELVDGAAAAQALVDTALRGRDPAIITRVCLSNKSYNEEAAGAIAQVCSVLREGRT